MQKEKIVIRYAKPEDFNQIMQFLKLYWSDHIFAKNEKYFKYYLFYNNKLTILFGEGANSKKIYGFCGYLLCNTKPKPDIQLCLLRVIENKLGFSSLHLLDFIQKNFSCRTLSCCGIRPKVDLIYQYMGFHVGYLKHYYRLADKQQYCIAKIKNKEIKRLEEGDYDLQCIYSMEELEQKFRFLEYEDVFPYKDKQCLQHRYFDSQGHHYIVYAIDKHIGYYESILVMREIEQNQHKLCKIVDFIGLDEDLKGIGGAIQRIMDKNDYEYIDFYCVGIDDCIMDKAGFILRKLDDENIIPQLFEPFIQENKNIIYCTNQIEGFHMYRGDSDQDRVNELEYIP